MELPAKNGSQRVDHRVYLVRIGKKPSRRPGVKAALVCLLIAVSGLIVIVAAASNALPR